MEIRAEIIISGLVQGVGFRYFTQQKARALGLVGYVRNLPDGNVYCEAEGEEGLVNELIHELRIGPLFGRVADVNVRKSRDLCHYQRFEVRL